MPYATALAMTAGGLDTRASQNAMYFHGRVARLAYGGLAEAEEEGARIAEALAGGITVLLMDNHGVLVVGRVGGRRLAPALLPRAGLPGAGARAVDRLGRCCRCRRRSRSTPRRSSAGFGGQAELFAAVRRELDRVNPGYER